MQKILLLQPFPEVLWVIFTSDPGLVFLNTSGLIDLSLSTPGTYTVTNTVAAAGGCPQVTATSQVTISPITVPGTVNGSASVCTGTNSTLLNLEGYKGNIIKWQSSPDGLPGQIS